METEILANLVITKVVSATTFYNPKNTKTRRTNRKRWAIVIKYEGETVYRSMGHRMVSDINHVILLPKGCTYEWECTESGHFSIIEFESEPCYPRPFAYSVKNGHKLLKLFKDLEYKRNLRNPMFEAESIRDTYSILLQAIEPALEKYIPNSKQQKIQTAIDYISQHLGERITNDILAQAAGMSTVYFRKTFTEATGTSPIVYAKLLRIEKAKEMLKSDYGTLTDVAQLLGYTNLYDFSRDFKKHTGIAPSKY